MKKRIFKIVTIICSGALLVLIVIACNKSFLNKPPLGTLNPSVLANEKGVQALLIGAYSCLDGEGGNGSGWGSAASNWVYGSVCADDAYKGSTPSDQGDILPLETYTATPSNPYPLNKWQFCYNAIQRCNDVLRVMAQATDIPADEQTVIAAQARFLRGFYHFELKKVFGNVPYVDETITVENAGSVENGTDIWPNIEADFQAGIDGLPIDWSSNGEIGRANKGAAIAYLAKTYMFEHKYSDAAPLLDQLINNTGGVGVTSSGDRYELVNYQDNFNPATRNSAESIFAAQMTVNDGSGDVGNGNGNYGDVLNFPYGGGPGACCGFFNPSQSLANAYKTDANGLPLLDESYNTGKNVSDPTDPYTGTLDPRIDWAIGREGIPYLDWGPHPGDAWIRDPQNNGHFNPKKNVYAKSQQGTYSDVSTNWAGVELVANNVNLIRYADVILWRAECYAQANDLPNAMAMVNQVRERAADPTGWVYKNATYDATTGKYSPQTTKADNYLIKDYTSFPTQDYAMKAIEFERRLELSMEGHRFFDLARWDKGTGSMAATLNAYVSFEKTLRPAFVGVSFTKGKNEIFAIPQNAIDIQNADGVQHLKQNPGY
jgi:hypothetical protein